MAIIRPKGPKPRIEGGDYCTSKAGAQIFVKEMELNAVSLNIDHQWFNKEDLIEFRDLLNEFIEAL